MNHEDPTRREFLLRVARGTVYSAPLIATFTVAPDLLAQQGSPPLHHHMHAAPSAPEAPTAPSDAPGASPTEKHPPPSKRGEGG